MNRDDVKMTNENEIITLNLENKENEERYKSLSNILNYQNNNSTENFLKDMLDRIQKISMFIKKIKLEEDSKYYESQSKEYAKHLHLAKMKIEKILIKCIVYSSKKTDRDREIDIKR